VLDTEKSRAEKTARAKGSEATQILGVFQFLENFATELVEIIGLKFETRIHPADLVMKRKEIDATRRVMRSH
jgi:lipid II:glycine glycyltransferase (peptidoglycan interpeptide bridge formation enzyme)